MGMFDYIRCDYPLPGPGKLDDLEDLDINFQTKDLNNYLETYVIREDGILEGPDGPMSDFTGKINFYWSNWASCSHGMTFTRNGEDFIQLEYDAVFHEGRLVSLVEIENSREVALKSSVTWGEPETLEERQMRVAREKESLLNKRVFIRWGGSPEGYWSTVIAETDRNWICLAEGRHEAENVSRSHRDNILFDSKEEADIFVKNREDKWNAEKQEYEAALAAKKKERETL